MNQTKTKYAIERVTQIYNDKRDRTKEKHTTEGKELTEQQRATLVRQGKVKIHSGVKRISTYARVTNVFDFSKFESETKIDPKVDKELEKLQKEFNRIKDEIMLGDEQEALELIRKFEG